MVLSDNPLQTEPQTEDPALWSWRGRLQGGSVDLRIPLHCASLGDALTVPVASGNCVSSVDLIFPVCKIWSVGISGFQQILSGSCLV